jgi:hypothetical protein
VCGLPRWYAVRGKTGVEARVESVLPSRHPDAFRAGPMTMSPAAPRWDHPVRKADQPFDAGQLNWMLEAFLERLVENQCLREKP